MFRIEAKYSGQYGFKSKVSAEKKASEISKWSQDKVEVRTENGNLIATFLKGEKVTENGIE